MANYVLNMLGMETATIASGASLSPAVNLGGLRAFGIVMPSAWTAASVSFQMSCDDGASWVDVYDTTGAEVVIPAAASRFIALDPVVFAAIPMIRVRSGSAASPVTQGADRAIGLVTRSV